ncbi:DUF814 domain-containing protein, partial [Candidatus Micrarchaeota archaeon]|nr:DUF814 domain-containing protein [Candidatus Micrarchaeota archaeon]
MKIILDLKKSLFENASFLYSESKKFKAKADGARKALIQSEKKLALEEKKQSVASKRKVLVKDFRTREWFERFHYFNTSNNLLAVAGKDSKQNDSLYKNYFEEGDLFFHADVQGSPALLLKKGVNASVEDKSEAAQFVACYSSAWKRGLLNVNVYCAKKSQVDKHVSGEFLAQGAFMIRGEREWFKHSLLKLAIGVRDSRLLAQPDSCKQSLQERVVLVPGNTEKKK